MNIVRPRIRTPVVEYCKAVDKVVIGNSLLSVTSLEDHANPLVILVSIGLQTKQKY